MEILDHLETRTTWEWSKRNHLDLSLQTHLLLPGTRCLTSVCGQRVPNYDLHVLQKLHSEPPHSLMVP